MAILTEPGAFRTAQLAYIDDEFSNLVENDLGLKDAFFDLCCETHDALDRSHWGKRINYRPCASSDLNLSLPGPDKTRDLLPVPLQQRWLAWRDDYARLIAQNPRLDLADQMQEISEMNDASSWPYGQEDAIRDWVESDDIAKFPFRTVRGFPSEAFYCHLQDFRRNTKGWLYWSDEKNRFVFGNDL